MIILDYSQIALSNILPFQNDIKRQSPEEIKNLIRHTTLSTIKSYKKRYGNEYGEVVIACDGRNYWRKSIFPHYKAHRKANRDKSDLDWGFIFDTLGELRDDLIKYFPYKVLLVDTAEADDIIAILTEYTQENQLIQEGLFESPQKVLIVSSDKAELSTENSFGLSISLSKYLPTILIVSNSISSIIFLSFNKMLVLVLVSTTRWDD